jgi:hypothetical protein
LNADTLTATEARPGSTVLQMDFGAAGNAREFMVRGWSSPEEHLCWMTDLDSELQIRHSFVPGDHLIELDVDPLLEPPGLTGQRLAIAVNGIPLAESRITYDGRFGYRVPAAALAGRDTCCIVLTHPDAARPCDIRASPDVRSLSLAVIRLRMTRVRDGAAPRFLAGTRGITPAELERRVGMEQARLLLRFESLGNNCEFGLLQRLCGAEPFFSLLRFGGAELPTLLRAFDLGFRDFGEPANLEMRIDDKDPPEWVAHELRYGIFFHTFRLASESDAASLHQSESQRLAYCAKRLLGDLAQGKKIFVLKRNEPLTEAQVLPVYAALASFGRNTLLWVVTADAEHPSGSVELVMPGLLKGFIGRFAPHENVPDLALPDWLEICANAYQLAQADDIG